MEDILCLVLNFVLVEFCVLSEIHVSKIRFKQINEDILCLVLNFVLVEFCVLSEIRVSKTRFKQINENLRLNIYARMF